MIAAGVNAKALSTYMGHASVTITYDRYGHLMPGNESEAAALLDAYPARADTKRDSRRSGLESVRATSGRSSKACCATIGQMEGGLLRDVGLASARRSVLSRQGIHAARWPRRWHGRQVVDQGLPYASIEIESPALAKPTTGYITNKLDFQHLWQAFNVRGVGDDEEVIVVWNKSNLKRVGRWLSRGMPGPIVWICPRQAYELMTDPSFRPGLDGMDRHRATSPIVRWEPEVMH